MEQTFTAFFKRGHGFPRYRASARYHAATFRVGDGLTLKKDRRIGVVGVPGGIKAVWHRDLPPDAKLGTAILTRQQGKWYVVLSVEAKFEEACGSGTVGIDLGLNSLIATSDGETVAAPRFAGKVQRAQRRRQRALARCRRAAGVASRRRRGSPPGPPGSHASGATTCTSSRGPWSLASRASPSRTSTWPG